MQALLDNLELAARGRLTELQAHCGVDAEDIAEMLAELRALDPKPGLRFAQVRVEVAVPDVHVRRAPGGGWASSSTPRRCRRVLLNNVYAQPRCARETRRPGPSSRNAAPAPAGWCAASSSGRGRSCSVASEIVRRQDEFFSPACHATPAADPAGDRRHAGLHESTVSRVTAGKYLSCDQGCYEFRFFFSSAIQAMSGGEAFSAAAVQERICGFVQAERPAGPLSDDKIVALLNGEGIDIARRTVAKYRDEMGIPSSVERRRLKNPLIRTLKVRRVDGARG